MRRTARIGPTFGLALSLGLCLTLAISGPRAPMAEGAPHTISAKGGHGWMKFWSDGPGKVRVAGKGSLTIQNLSRLDLKVDGTWGEKRDLPDGVAYTHFEGSVESVGIGAHIEIRGWNLELSAKGKGKAHFQGEGMVRVDDGAEKAWPGEMTPHGWLKVHFGD